MLLLAVNKAARDKWGMASITSRDELEQWLINKPTEWAQVISARAALREFPLFGYEYGDNFEDMAVCSFRAIAFPWIARNFPALDVDDAAYFAHLNFDKFRTSIEAPRFATFASINHNDPSEVLESAVSAVCDADDTAMSSDAAAAVWEAVSADCNWLVERPEEHAAARTITRKSLWLGKVPPASQEDWRESVGRLLATTSSFAVWIDWYERRIRGERSAFEIPGDKYRKEDKKILRRLAEATDEDFWGKGHEYVNATLKGWLDEARARVVPPPIEIPIGLATEKDTAFPLTVAVLDAIKPDPQDARSPQFGSDSAGRIEIKADAGTDQLRTDAQSLSRHARVIQMAQRLGEALRNHNNAGYMTEMVSDYIAAMEGSLDGPDPSGLVFAGDQLREAIAKHRAAGANDDLQPLPPSADKDASAFLSAHNMYVGSDPFLDDLDRTTRGPDAPLPSANPDEIRRVAKTARHDYILAEPTYDFMVAASNAAPATYDSADRHSRFAAGLAQNFARYSIEFLWTYPTEAAWASVAAGVGVTVMLGPLAAVGGTVAGIGIAYNLARNMIANEAIYRKWLATSPAGEDNFNSLIRFLKSLPIKSLKDD